MKVTVFLADGSPVTLGLYSLEMQRQKERDGRPEDSRIDPHTPHIKK